MRVEELRFVCQEAARDLAGRGERPLPPAVVLPAREATRIVTLPDLPPDDGGRFAALQAFVRDEVLPHQHPAYGFVSEAEVDGVDVVVVVCGATGVAPHITAAPWVGDTELGEFTTAEPLDPHALPFLHPLQHAVEAAAEPPR